MFNIKNKIIAIDCDLTLFSTDIQWLDYLKQHCVSFDNKRFMHDFESRDIHYNLTNYFTFKDGFNGLDFFDLPSTYKEAKLLVNAKEVITKLAENNTIVFVSFCGHSQQHAQNKINRIIKEFPDLKNNLHFVSTNNKAIVKCDVIIDDRVHFLNQMPDNVIRILMDTPYTNENLKNGENLYFVANWRHISNLLLEPNF